MTSLNHKIDRQELNSSVKETAEDASSLSKDGSFPNEFGISTRVVPFPEPVGVSTGGTQTRSRKGNSGSTIMKDKDGLGTVPDASMLSLFKSLVGFMVEESKGRGWEDVTSRLQAVEAALGTRKDAKSGSK